MPAGALERPQRIQGGQTPAHVSSTEKAPIGELRLTLRHFPGNPHRPNEKNSIYSFQIII
jgi:hypothetical protein